MPLDVVVVTAVCIYFLLLGFAVLFFMGVSRLEALHDSSLRVLDMDADLPADDSSVLGGNR